LNLAEAKIHFVGIGGIGMSGIAELLANMGCQVTGSDQSANTQVERLKAMGVTIYLGHKAENIPQMCDALVYSSAVKPTNPEIQEAKRRLIPIIQRAEMLAELMSLKRGIAIAGSHGKTTTTSMTAAMMIAAKLDPTIVIGGRLDLIKSTAALGKGEWLVAEADESDGSFLRLQPEICVITNIDNDHLDHYKNFENLKKAFSDFTHKVPFYGEAILCVDDEYVAQLAHSFEKRMMTYGFSKDARLRASDVKTQNAGSQGFTQSFEVELDNKSLGRITLHVPGRHNVLNALACVAVGLELKLSFAAIAGGLEDYKGVDRRLQHKGEYQGALVVDDYGHHPTEVDATLEAMKSAYPKHRLVVVFQPHRYSRTQSCWQQFLSSFKKADVVGLLDIYPAGEAPIQGVTSSRLAQELTQKQKNVFYWGDHQTALKELGSLLKPGDLLITLGAGDVWKLSGELLQK
jgi:UDP-N-acetylmuramate--alanine ligase